MSNNTNEKAPSITGANGSAKVLDTRKPGVPGRQQLYEILKARSLELQSRVVKR